MPHEIAPGLLKAFIRESNWIENIIREPYEHELSCTAKFLKFDALTPLTMEWLVGVYQPGASLRMKVGMDVRVGNYLPPVGGPALRAKLDTLLRKVHEIDPFLLYCEYEAIHPFMDGNGCSGRALWLWAKIRQGYRGSNLFLNQWHYDTLSRYAKT